MRKTAAVIAKNIKLLARSKGSALVVLLAPLIIVLIIGVGFNDTSQAKLNIGIYKNSPTELTERFIQNLNNTENNLIIFEEEERCVQGIKEGTLVTCIIFPEEFKLETGKTNEIKFYVDDSRLNLVYRIIASLTSNLETESTEVTQELTGKLLDIMNKASQETDASLVKLLTIKSVSEATRTTASSTKTNMESLDTEFIDINTAGYSTDVITARNKFNSLRSQAGDVIDEGYDIISYVNDDNQTADFKAVLLDLEETVNESNTTYQELTDLSEKITQLDTDIDLLKTKLEQAGNAKTTTITSLNSMTANINKMQADADAIKRSQENIQTQINSFTLKSAENIASPITTNIQTVTTSTSKITFSFPYLLMLVVLFVGMMLSSTLIWLEKDSRAYFRNFTTPARSGFFIALTYLTSLLIILIQVILILAAVTILLNVPILENIPVTIVATLLAITVFTLIGMIVGYFFNTSEAMTMSTIALGAVMIFFSNLILPIETLSPVIQSIANYNPYVMASETIRRAVLFGAGFDTLYLNLLILAAYAAIALTLALIIYYIKASRLRGALHGKFGKSTITIPEDHYLLILEKDIVIKNIPDLLDAIRQLSEEEYNKLARPNNIFSRWLKENLKERNLARKIRTKSKQDAIEIILKYLSR